MGTDLGNGRASRADQTRVRRFYQNYIRDHPDGGGWPSHEAARVVYETATASHLIPLAELRSVLDIGSGEGRFLEFLRKEGFLGSYVGVELLASFHKTAYERYGNHPRTQFLQRDFLECEISELFDWSFALGTIGTLQEGKDDYDREIIQKMIGLSRKGITLYVNDDRLIAPERLMEVEDLAAHDVEKLVELLEEECPKAELDIVVDQCPSPTSVAINLRLW